MVTGEEEGWGECEGGGRVGEGGEKKEKKKRVISNRGHY